MADTDEIAHLTVDVVLLAEVENELFVLLIQRRWPPYEDRWALPGGHVNTWEVIETAARRELTEETGLITEHLTLVGVYSTPHRDPRGRYVSWAFVSTLTDIPTPAAADDASLARWWPLPEALQLPLAFDHQRILRHAVLNRTTPGRVST